MTESKTPDWLKVGGNAAYVFANGSRVVPVTVKRVGKRDVVVANKAGTEFRFNVNNTVKRGDDEVWLYSSTSRYSSQELGPQDSPRVAEVTRGEALASARFKIGDTADTFRMSPTVETAKDIIQAAQDWIATHEGR